MFANRNISHSLNVYALNSTMQIQGLETTGNPHLQNKARDLGCDYAICARYPCHVKLMIGFFNIHEDCLVWVQKCFE